MLWSEFIIKSANIICLLTCILHLITQNQLMVVKQDYYDSETDQDADNLSQPLRLNSAMLIGAMIVQLLSSFYFGLFMRDYNQQKEFITTNINLTLIMVSLSLQTSVAVVTGFEATHKMSTDGHSDSMKSDIEYLNRLMVAQTVVTFCAAVPCQILLLYMSAQLWCKVAYVKVKEVFEGQSFLGMAMVSFLLFFNAITHIVLVIFSFIYAGYEDRDNGNNEMMLKVISPNIFILITALWLIFTIILNIYNFTMLFREQQTEKISNFTYFATWSSLVLNSAITIYTSSRLIENNYVNGTSISDYVDQRKNYLIALWADVFITPILGITTGSILIGFNLFDLAKYKLQKKNVLMNEETTESLRVQ